MKRSNLSEGVGFNWVGFKNVGTRVQTSTCFQRSFRMSLVKKDGRISVKQFAVVPPLLDLPAIQRDPASASVSSFQGPEGGVDLAEGCIVTKFVRYTHQLAHMVNAVRSGDSGDVVSR